MGFGKVHRVTQVKEVRTRVPGQRNSRSRSQEAGRWLERGLEGAVLG